MYWARLPPRESKRPALDQRLDHLLVDLLQVDPLAEVVQRDKGLLAARLDDRLQGGGADPLDGAEAEADRLVVDGEGALRGVDVRRQHLDPHGAHLGDVLDHLVGVLHVLGQKRRHELHRIVGLEVGGVVGDQGVGGRVGLVEAVGGEHLHQVEDPAGLLDVELVLFRPGDELLPLLGHLLGLLLPHRPAQQVGAAEAVAGQDLGDEHDLLLVDDDPVGVLEDRLELREVVGDRLLAVLALDEVVDHPRAQGAGPVEGADGDDVLEAVGLELDQAAPSSPRIRAGRRRWSRRGRGARRSPGRRR